MGSSPKADLYWGYPLGDLSDPKTYDDLRPQWWKGDDEDEYGWEDVDTLYERQLLLKLGWDHEEPPYPPWPNIPRDATHEQRQAIHEAHQETPAAKAYNEYRSARQAMLDSVPGCVESFGYEGDGNYVAFIRPSRQHFYGWESAPLGLMLVEPTWRAQLGHFMHLLEIPIPAGAEPGWHITVSYG